MPITETRKPGSAPATAPRGNIGDNMPPATDEDALKLRLREAHAVIFTRTAELLEAEKRVPAELDEETAASAGDFVVQIAACIKQGNNAHDAEKEPFLAAGRTVDALFFKIVRDPLAAAKARVEAKITAHMRRKANEERQRREVAERAAREAAERAQAAAAEAERQRRAAEEAERRRAEEEARRIQSDADLASALDREREAAARQAEIDAAAAEAQRLADQAAADAQKAAREAAVRDAELSQTRGEQSVGSLRQFWDHRDVDRDVLNSTLGPLGPFFNDEAIDKAIRAWIRANADGNRTLASGGQPIPGVTIFRNSKAAVR